ncbi:hypothetical protein GS500_22660 [Rhodococcus hoagii]|nr:hypothetical protein [Prescottella equi]
MHPNTVDYRVGRISPVWGGFSRPFTVANWWRRHSLSAR